VPAGDSKEPAVNDKPPEGGTWSIDGNELVGEHVGVPQVARLEPPPATIPETTREHVEWKGGRERRRQGVQVKKHR